MNYQAREVAGPDGVRLAVRESGNPDGAPIIFIHGISQCQLAFSAQVASPLLQNFRLVSYDLRGHGESDKPAGSAPYAQGVHWSNDLKAVIDSLAPSTSSSSSSPSAMPAARKPVLAGWSLGGRVISQYLADHGDSALAGINFIAAPAISDRAHPSLGADGKLLLAMRSATIEENIAATAQFIRGCVARALSADQFATMLAYNMLTPPEVRRAALEWPGGKAGPVAAIRVPTLVSHGTADTVILPVASELIVAQVPHARLSIYQDAGHSLFWEYPERYNAELAAFVTAAQGQA